MASRISLNASNARQGIKTDRAAETCAPLSRGLNASNARQGIKTHHRLGGFGLRRRV